MVIEKLSQLRIFFSLLKSWIVVLRCYGSTPCQIASSTHNVLNGVCTAGRSSSSKADALQYSSAQGLFRDTSKIQTNKLPATNTGFLKKLFSILDTLYIWEYIVK